MGTPWPENQCAHRKGTIEKLIKDQARDTAAQLQILSENPTGDHDGPEKLLVKLLTSFTKSLSHISLCSCEDCECEVTQIPKRVGSPISDQRSENSGEGCKRPAAEDRRGWYKRRKTSKMRMAATNEDGHAWRKYGQKEILQAQFPRSYSLNIPLLEAHLRSISPKTFSDSGSHSRSFSSISISTQYTSSCPSSVASVRQECWGESGDIVQIVRSNTLAIWKMKNLKFLKGISEIPDLHLTFMLFNVRGYLRECLMLCKIRGEIGLLKSLTHFDMSKCYSLDHMPKEISNLLQLEVLKGIVVGNSMEKEKDSCTLEHLAKLTKLRKLSIYTKREDFPVISALRDLNRLKKLHKLKIEWGGVSVHKSENITKVDNSSEEMASPELPPQLEELHLKCLPRKSAPDWLRASKRNKIKKLHIEGGPLSDLGQLALQEKSEWQVEILRLKFLKDLEMNWTDLRKLFPKLIYFEKVSCPKLQFFPCDEQGVWKEKANEQF